MTQPIQWPEDAEARIFEAAKLGLSDKVIGNLMGCSEQSLRNHFDPVLKRGRATRQVLLSRMQWKAAEKGNPALLIFLGKQTLDRGGLGQTDEYTFGEVDLTRLSDEELEAIAAGKARPQLKVEDGGLAAAPAEAPPPAAPKKKRGRTRAG